MPAYLPRRAAVRVLATAGLIVTVTALPGCSGGSGTSAGSASAGGVTAVPAAVPAHAADAATGGAGQPGGVARMLAAGQSIVYSASMTVQVASVGQAAARAAEMAAQAGGYVSQENATFRPAGGRRAAASIQLKIPVPGYPAALSRLAGLGTQTSLQQQTQDVTAQVADTVSRVASDQAAIAQLRSFLSRAGTIGELLAVQGEINSQESALEAMQAQQRALDHETVYATVSLHLVGPAAGHQRPARRARGKPGPAGGFVGGFKAGWKALVTLISWLLRALGAVLPIGAACALAGYLGYRGLRGRRWLRRRARPAGG